MSHLKLVTYNIRRGLDLETAISNLENFAEQGVNLFCLQEVRKQRDAAFIGDLLLQRLGTGWQAEYLLSPELNGWDYGLAIFWQSSELKPVKFERLSLPKLDKLSPFEKLFVRMQINETKPFRRGALIGTFSLGDKSVRITNIHLDWQGRFRWRFSQLQYLVKFLQKSSPVDSEVVCGDFNTIGFVMPKKQIRALRELMGSQFKDAFPNPPPTAQFNQRLDHIFVRNLAIKKAQVYKLPGSDHFPLYVEAVA